MRNPELTVMSLSDLLALRSGIDEEVASRNHVRTSSSLAGELMKRTVSVAYNGRNFWGPLRRSAF